MTAAACILIFMVGLVSAAWVAWEIHRAPEGYEDENGYHVGSKL